jgi:hypothetical protein
MTKLTESYFEMMNASTGGDNNINRLLQDNTMLNCTYEEELSCSAGTIVSSFLLFTNNTD